jgi:hypothetical protein
MKTKIYFLFFMAIAFSISSKAQYINIANNGNVEATSDTTGGKVAPFWSKAAPAANATYSIVSDTVHSGSNAIKIVVVNRASISGLADWSIQIINEFIKVHKNAGYKYSIWARASSSVLKVNFTMGNSSYSEVGKISGKALTKDWAEYGFMFNSGANDSLRAPIHLLNDGTYFFDDFSIVQTPLQNVYASKAGDSIMLLAGWPLAVIDPTFDISTITASINGKAVDITSVANNTKNKNIVQCKLSSKIHKGDTVTVSYNGTGLAFSGTSSPDTFDIFSNVPVDLSALNSVVVESSEINNISIYPNPVENNIRFVSNNKISSVVVSNISGQILLKFNNVFNNTVDVSALKEGIYFVTLNNKLTLKFIKK